MELKSYFTDFLSEIRLTENQTSDLKTGHTTLRDRLSSDETLSPIIVSTFLQGSYRRATAVRPKGDSRSDVDVIVVTKLSKDEYTPQQALEVFVPFLDKHYKDKYRIQGRSIGISLSYVDLDLVVTAAPSESEIGILQSESVTTDDTTEDAADWKLCKSWVAVEHRGSAMSWQLLAEAKSEEEWKLSPLLIPNREADEWEETHPLAQIQWTRDKNGKCNGHYVNVVKALKWWRRLNSEPKHPKSYPLEHLIGVCCPDDTTSVAEGVVLSLETLVRDYPEKPFLPDHGVPSHDVLGRVTDDDYESFYNLASSAAKIARKAFDATTVAESACLWRELFGSKFPEPPKTSSGAGQGGFSARTEKTLIGGGRFA